MQFREPHHVQAVFLAGVKPFSGSCIKIVLPPPV
jgi:hypothetical protein